MLHAASLLSTRLPSHDALPTGVAALGGLPRGAVAEVTGPRSSGKTALMLSAMAGATQRGETCAMVDVHGSFDPASAARSGVALSNLVWVRCRGDAGAAMKAADLLIHGGGFGIVCIDLADVPVRVLNRLPISYWYRFRRAVEDTPAIALIVSEHPLARSCAAWSVECEQEGVEWTGKLLTGLRAAARRRKPAQGSAAFLARAV